MKAIIAHEGVRGHENGHQIDRPKGSTVDHPDAWKLVHCGVAVPGDDECREKAGLTADEIKARVMAYKKMSEENIILEAHGINPEDPGDGESELEDSGGLIDDDGDEE